jgi:ketosteroid isomerase-like protein
MVKSEGLKALAGRSIVFMGMSLALISVPPASAASDNAAILVANSAFYAALNQMFVGNLGPMKEVWSKADDVTYMGPTGNFERGWKTVLKDWEGQAALKLGGHVKPVQIHVIAGQDLAVVSDYEEGKNTNAQGKIERVRLRATNIYRKEGGQWKMVGHHTDPLPYLTKK